MMKKTKRTARAKRVAKNKHKRHYAKQNEPVFNTLSMYKMISSMPQLFFVSEFSEVKRHD